MKTLLFAAASAAALFAATTAKAADLPQSAVPYIPPVHADYDWTGFYVGVNAGVAWLEEDISGVNDLGFSVSASDSDTSFTYGGQVGYNHQIEQLVLGIEADFNVLDAGSELLFTGKTTTYWDSDYDWFATIRGRVGYAADETLFYATAGIAFLRDELDIVNGATTGHSKKTLEGFTIGGGIEHAFSETLSGKVEYLYADFKSHSVSNGLASVKTNPELHVLRIGLNYHF